MAIRELPTENPSFLRKVQLQRGHELMVGLGRLGGLRRSSGQCPRHIEHMHRTTPGFQGKNVSRIRSDE